MSLSVDDVKKEIGEVKAKLATVEDDLQAAKTNGSEALILAGMSLVDTLEKRLTGLESLLPKPSAPEQHPLTTRSPPSKRVRISSPLLPTAKARFQADGIAGSIYLERDSLVSKIVDAIPGNRFVLLSAPPAMGKTSLMQLVDSKLQQTFQVFYFTCLSCDDAFALLLRKTGIDLESQKHPSYNSKVLVMMDDVQAIYSHEAFWNKLVKESGVWLPKDMFFLLGATHQLNIGQDSPVTFSAFSRFSRDDFLLSRNDGLELIRLLSSGSKIVCQEYVTLKDVLINECAGLIGAIALSVHCITEHFRKQEPSEQEILKYIFSSLFISNMHRCFGSNHAEPTGELLDFLRQCFIRECVNAPSLNNGHRAIYNSLLKAGVIIEKEFMCSFSSPLAERFFFHMIFPSRALTAPSSLRELIVNSLKVMSAGLLQKSTPSPQDFPNEAAFQHAFMLAMASQLPPKQFICPELSKVFPDKSKASPTRIPGQVDFYINHELRWGIELLVQGRGVAEHLNRFAPEGKYYSLDVTEYVVISFRSSTKEKLPNVRRFESLMSVFFVDNNFTKCRCYYGLDESILDIELQP